MTPLIFVTHHGNVGIEYQEWVFSLLYILFLYLYFARRKNIMIKAHPEYKYYLWSLMAKIMSGMLFSLIYFYHYKGGDTLGYFYSAVAMRNMAFTDPGIYWDQMMGSNTLADWSVYTAETAKPYKYLFFDERTFLVIRLVSLFAIFTFKSYLISTLLITSASFFGIWACYRTFVSYYPQLAGKLATAFLFMPSPLFWGSAILKDTFTFSAVCWWVHAVDEVFFKRRKPFANTVIIILSGIIMVVIKPYIFMVLFPATLLWLFYFRLVRVRNFMIKFVLLPAMGVGLVGLSIFVLSRMSNLLDKFALEEALVTIQVTQADLSNATSYGANSFDLGEFDGTWTGVVSKFPAAVNAALFRPYLWESSSWVMVMSGLENAWVLVLTVLALVRAGPRFFLRCMGGIPLLLMAVTFALLFAFTVGVTTPNFGALVRFKIPLVPFYISTMYIIVYLAKLKRERENHGLRFDLREYRMGTAHLGDTSALGREKRRKKGSRLGGSPIPA